MFENKSTAQEIIERLSSSYGVKSQRELAKALDIPPNNVSAWAQRGSVPGNSIIKCALDTGADLNWLVNGELANANSIHATPKRQGKELYERIMSHGGKIVLRRILDAYGFSTQKQLCDLLGISSGTVSTWVRRNFFPGDVVVTCSLDTGVPLSWLALGEARADDQTLLDKGNCIWLTKYSISSGELKEIGKWCVDPTFISFSHEDVAFVEKGDTSWLVDFKEEVITSGHWLLCFDGIYEVYEVQRLPGNTISLLRGAKEFSCAISDVQCIGKIKKIFLNS